MTSLNRRGSPKPRFTCWHPLLPSFSAKLIVVLRSLIGIVSCAVFTLSPRTSGILQGQLLLGVSMIVALQNTLGATIQSAIRLFFAGGLGTGYCLLVINYLPCNVFYAVGATNVLVLLIVYTDLPVVVRRFTIVPSCIILLQWFSKPEKINSRFALEIWASLSLGAAFAIGVSCLPFPVPPTAYRELTMRMRFIARQVRREITAIVLLISEYHNVHLPDENGNENDKQRKNKNKKDDIEVPANTYREDDLYHHSTSFENIRDDHLLKSDIHDLNALVNEELKQMQRASGEIDYEPYFFGLKFANILRKTLARIPFLTKLIAKPSTLQQRLIIWVTGLVSLQRVISAMLALDHHHAFVGQRRLINAICCLLDSTFNFLDATLPYTTSSTSSFNTAHIISCRSKVEEALEHFFETFEDFREHPRHSNVSNTDLIQLNTFLLLILRLVHVVIQAAESAHTPGAHLDSGNESSNPLSASKPFHWQQPFRDLAAYIGLRPSFGKLVRAFKTSLSVLLSAVVVIIYRDRLQAGGWIHWAPMTTALVSDASEGGTLRLSFQRLSAVLLGSTYAYLIVLITQSLVGVGICISLFVAFMAYVKTDPTRAYFANVCAQSASVITFLSNQHGPSASKGATLARTSLTFLGIFIHVIVSNLVLPISARALTKKKMSAMIKGVSEGLHAASDDFCSFAGTSTLPCAQQTATAAASTEPTFNLNASLAHTERIADGCPALIEEALNEPNLWKRPFIQVKDRYGDITKSLRTIVRGIRFVHRCTTILKAETQLHFAQEAKWLQRRSSLAVIAAANSKRPHTWTINELRKLPQIQDELDIPLTIFIGSHHSRTTSMIEESNEEPTSNGSSTMSPMNTGSYQPVLEHIRKLEQDIQKVLSLAGQLLEKQATVDIGSYELRQLCRENSLEEFKRDGNNARRLSFHSTYNPIPISSYHYSILSCFRSTRGKDKSVEPLPSLRNAVDVMLETLVEFLYANNRFTRTRLATIGDSLAFHTLSYAFKEMVEATTDLAKNARRIKHIDTRTLSRTEREEKYSSTV